MEIKTLNEQIERLRELIRKCYATVAGKNGTIPDVTERTMENLPAAIGSIISASDIPKIKVYSVRATNDCINEDGVWESHGLLDTSNVMSFLYMMENVSLLKHLDVTNWVTSRTISLERMFFGCTSLEELDTTKWDVRNIKSMYYVFRGCVRLKSIGDTSNWDVRNVQTMSCMFQQCSQLTHLDVSNWEPNSCTGMTAMFDGCTKLKELDVSKWDVSKCESISYMFRNCSSLVQLDLTGWNVSAVTGTTDFIQGAGCTNLIGGRSIEEVISSNISCLNGLKVSINISTNPILDRASLRALINGLADLTGQTAQTLTLRATQLARLTEEDIAIATNKNWTIV